MFARELLLVCVLCGVGFTSTVLEKGKQRSECRPQRVLCPCKDKHGVSGHVLVVTCSDHKDLKIPVCRGKAYSEECGKGYFLSKRQRRDTGNCRNGMISASNDSSATGDPVKVSMHSGSNKTVHVDDRFTFKCKVYSNLPANITWLFNGKPLDSKLKEEKYLFAPCNQNLEVREISKSDAGNYTCVVTNEKGRNVSATVNLIVKLRHGPPVIEYAKLERWNTAYIGTTVNITCKIQSPVEANGKFLKNSKQINEDDEELKYEYHYLHVTEKDKANSLLTKLEIKNVTMEDAGNYTCEVLQDDTQTSSKTFFLKVGPCPAGFYCLPGRPGRIQCPPGLYQLNISQSSEQACKPCPAGFYCPSEATGPIPCPIGTYQPHINQKSKHACIQCTAGFYCPPGQPGRIQCPQGTYQRNIGQTSEEACKPCPYFLTNSSKYPIGRDQPIVNKTDCLLEDPTTTRKVSATTSSYVTIVVVGSATGVILFTVLALLLLFFIAKKRRCPWFSSFRHSHDPESSVLMSTYFEGD